MRRTCWTSMLTLVLFASSARATTLGPWTLGPATNGNYEHDGIAGVPGYLYTVTGTSAEVAPIFVDGSVGSWTVTSSLNFARAYGRTLATASNVYVAGGWPPGQPGSNTATVEVASILPDGSLGPWAYTSPMLQPRGNEAGVLGAGRIYVLGNYLGTTSVESAAIQPARGMTAQQQSKLRAMLRRLGAEDLGAKEHPPRRAPQLPRPHVAHPLRGTSASCRRALLSGTSCA